MKRKKIPVISFFLVVLFLNLEHDQVRFEFNQLEIGYIYIYFGLRRRIFHIESKQKRVLLILLLFSMECNFYYYCFSIYTCILAVFIFKMLRLSLISCRQITGTKFEK